jgi:SmpA / OmlA family
MSMLVRSFYKGTGVCARWWLALVVAATVGPAAAQVVVSDSFEPGGYFFVVTAVNGVAVPENAASASRRASYGRGGSLTMRGFSHILDPGPTKLSIEGTPVDAAPIQSIFRAAFGSIPSVKGTLEVNLKPSTRYRVRGVLDAYRSEVWLEEADTQQLVGAKITVAADPELAKAMEGAGYACCNLRYEDKWIDDTPWPHLPFVPAGARIKVLDYSRNEVAVLIEGRRMRIGNSFSRGAESMQEMVARLVLPKDPRPTIAEWDSPVRDAVAAGRVLPGMTREQVEVALGRPRYTGTRSLNSKDWLYHLTNGEEAFVVFGADERVKEVDGSRAARKLLLATP